MREIKLHHVNKDEPETGIRIHAQGDMEGSDVHFYALTGFEFKFNNETVHEVPIVFQKGNPANGWNGLTIESLLAVCADRLENIQSGQWACTENEMALMNIHKAITQLHNRHKRLLNDQEDLRTLRADEGGEEAQKVAEAIAEAGGDWTKLAAEEEQKLMDSIEATIGVEGDAPSLPRLIPVYNDKNRDHFSSSEQVMPIQYKLTDESDPVSTSALRTGMSHDLMGLSYDQGLNDLGLIQIGDSLASDITVDGFYVEFEYDGKKETLPFSTNIGKGPVKAEGFGGQDATMVVSFEGEFGLTHDAILAVVDDDNPVNWATSSIMRKLISPAWEAWFQVGLSGMVNLPTASINISPSGLYLSHFTQPGCPDVKIDVDQETKEKITHLLKTATVIAFDVTAYRQPPETPKAAA